MTYPRPRVAAIVLLGLTAALLLDGCSSGQTNPTNTAAASATGAPSAGDSPSANTGAATACSLITQQEASAALGSDPGPGIAGVLGVATTCTFGTPPSVLTVDLVPTGGKAAYEQTHGGAKAHQLVTISGVGDAALGMFEGPIGAIYFYKGDALVSVLLTTNQANATSQDKMTALANTAAGRL